MSEEIASISNLSVDFISVVTILVAILAVSGTIVSSYAAFVIKSLIKQIAKLEKDINDDADDLKESIHEDIVEIKKNHTKLRDRTNNVSERLAKAETDISNLKNISNNKRGV
ncbi:hypothetical protein KAR91_29835 [Candidatus Pacearchaeota archaeon]|nr:hypothetical protein [Candidatus Pacearchaeota archaeon]